MVKGLPTKKAWNHILDMRFNCADERDLNEEEMDDLFYCHKNCKKGINVEFVDEVEPRTSAMSIMVRCGKGSSRPLSSLSMTSSQLSAPRPHLGIG
jgi:hypothetical protein